MLPEDKPASHLRVVQVSPGHSLSSPIVVFHDGSAWWYSGGYWRLLWQPREHAPEGGAQ